MLSVPAFTGATAEDNVLELLGDCKVDRVLTFPKPCTIRTKRGLDAKKVLFASPDVHCLVGSAAVKAFNVTFDGKVGGEVVGNAAWGLTTNGGSLTLGDGVTVCNFRPVGSKINSNFCGAVVISAQTATLNILEGAKICDISGNGAAVTVCNGTTAVVNMSGGEITRCSSNTGNRGGGAIDMDSGTLNLSGGSIRGNTASCGAGGICVVNDGRDGYVRVSGKPVVRDNVLLVRGKTATVANVGLTDGRHGAGHFVLAGDLTAGAHVGCSHSVGAGKAFGAADGNCAGAEFIHADGNDTLAGQRAGQELRWVRSGKVDISGCRVSVETLACTGRVQSPRLTVEESAVGGATLEKDVDYSISGDTSAQKAGAYYLTLTGRGDYVGTKVVGWRIVEAGRNGGDSDPIAPPLVGNTLRFLDAARRMNVVADRDYAVDGIVFGESTRTKISGGHAITVNAGNLKLLDQYKRIFLGDCELTLSGAGTRLTVNPNTSARQSAGLRLTAEDGAKFENRNSDFGDNGDYLYVARGPGSEVRICLDARPRSVDNYGFEAHSGGLVALTGRYSLEPGGISHAYVAEGGTLDLPAVRIRGGTPSVRIVGSGAIALGAAKLDGGTVTLKLDSSWNGSTAHLTVAGDLSLGANVRYSVDLAGFPNLAQTDRIALARAGGKVSVSAPKTGIDAVGGDGRRIELEADGGVVYLKLTDAPRRQDVWRWTSNARDASPDWRQADGDTLYLPAFTSAWAEDNVIELSGDCRVTDPVVFSGRLTMRSQPDTGVHTVRFAKSAARLVCDGTVVVSNLVFQGDIVWTEPRPSAAGRSVLNPAAAVSDDYAHTAWRVNRGQTLTLGPGTTVRNFLTRCADGGGAVHNAGGVLNILPGAVICDNRGNCDAVVNEGAGGMVNRAGGEFVRNYVTEPVPARGAREDAAPRLKFGVCSDLHLSTAYRGAQFFERALWWWKREGVDAIVIAGDIADCGDVDSCRMATNAITRVFGGNWPKMMVILGNHDKLGDVGVRRDVLRNIFRMGDETDEKAFFTKVKGYSFVGRSWPRDTSFSMAAFLESHAADLKGSKPFVFVQHPHPTGTCHGPYVWGQEAEIAGLDQAADFLKAYPNAVAFSGHSHYQICDERTVWKGDFISVGTGSMANQGTLPGRENSSNGGSVMPAAEACGVCAELVTFYDREMRIQRHEFWTRPEGDPIGDDWWVPFGEAGEWTFERRAADSLPPAFPRGAEVKVRSYTGTLRDKSSGSHKIWEVSFPTAPAHDGRPRAIDYEVTAVVSIFDCEWRSVKRVLSPHYGRTADIDTSATCLFVEDEKLQAGGQFVFFEVRPISPFGKAGESIRSQRFYR